MRYNAFISYSKMTDDTFVSSLRSALQNLAKPWYRLRSMRIFLDETGLAANAALWSSIESALKDSEYFLLLASPQAAQSTWVTREVTWWLENRSIKNMLILLVDGEIVWDNTINDYNWQKTTALPEILRNRFEAEPLHVDFRWVRKAEKNLTLRHPQFRSTVLKVAAPICGKLPDELDGEDIRQHKRNTLWASSAAIIICIAIVATFTWAYKAKYNSRIALSQQMAAQAELIGNQQANMLPQSVLLATESMKVAETFQANQALYHGLSLLGPKPTEQRSYIGLRNLVFSPQGQYLILLPYDGPAQVQKVMGGEIIASLRHSAPNTTPVLSVTQISFSADDKRIATLSSLGISTYVWDLPSGREIFRTPTHRGAIITVALSNDGSCLATGHTDGMVYLWNLSNSSELLSFSHTDPPQVIQFSPDGRSLAVTSSSSTYYGPSSISTIRLWDISKNTEIAQLQHPSAVTQLVFSPDGKHLASTSRVGADQDKNDRLGIVKIWETATGHAITQIQHEEAVNTIAFTPNSKYLLTGSSDDTLRISNVMNGDELLVIDHGSSVGLVDFVQIEGLSSFLTAGNDGTVRLWAAHSPAHELLRFIESPNITAFSQDVDGKYFATISHDLQADVSTPPDQYKEDVRVWTAASIMEKLDLAHEHMVVGARFIPPDGQYLVTFDSQLPTSKLIPTTRTTEVHTEYTDQGSGSVSVWSVETRKNVSHLKHPGTVMYIDHDQSGTYLTTACVDGIVRIFELPDGRNVANLQHDGWVYEVKISPDGKYVASSSGNTKLLEHKKGHGLVTIWEWQTGKAIGHLRTDDSISHLSFSPDGKLLAAGGYDGIVHILRTADGQELTRFMQDYSVQVIAFSPDGQYVATGSGGTAQDPLFQNGATTLWNVADGRTILAKENQRWVTTVAFSQDGHLAAMDGSGLCEIWSAADGEALTQLKADAEGTQAKIHFSPDGKYLATAFGTRAQIWEVSTGKEVARREHKGHGSLWDVAFSPNSKYLATTGTDTTAALWLWRPQDLIHEACARLPLDLTVGEEVNAQTTCANLMR